MNLDNAISEIERDFNDGCASVILKDRLQEIFNALLFEDENGDEQELQKTLAHAFCILRKINNAETHEKCFFEYCNLTRLAESLAFCCDAALCHTDKRIIFICDEKDMFFTGDKRMFCRAFSLIMAYFVKNSSGNYTSVVLRRDGNRAIFTVESDAVPDFRNLFSELGAEGSDLNYIYHIIYKHSGNIFVCTEKHRTTLVLFIPICEKTEHKEAVLPDMEELLFDRLSVIYEALY